MDPLSLSVGTTPSTTAAFETTKQLSVEAHHAGAVLPPKKKEKHITRSNSRNKPSKPFWRQ